MTLETRKTSRIGCALIIAGLAVSLAAYEARAQAAAPAAGLTLKATFANPNQSSDVKIDIVRWSTEQERTAVVASLSPPVAGRGGAASSDNTDPFGTFGGGGQRAAAAAQAGGGRGGRGGANRGGGRGGRGGDNAEPAPFDPVKSLATAIGSAPTLGYLWTNESSGYSIKYAHRTSLPDGGERIVLATSRRFAFLEGPTAVPDFMVLELRINSKGAGEGKAATSKVIADSQLKTIAPEDYAMATAVLRNVKR